MNTKANMDLLNSLKLKGMEQFYQSIIGLPANQHPDGHELLAQLLHAEQQHRSHKRTKMYLRLSKLRYSALIEQIHCNSERNITQQQINLLADCSYVERGENVLITGATGCGKSFLACALGNQACQMGIKTMYFNMNRFCETITMAKLEGSFIKLLNRLEKVQLIIFDDFGLQPLDHNVKLALLQILEDRYAKKAIIIAAQLPVNKWHEYINEPTIADAILDRLISKSHRLELKGKSMRKMIEKKS